MKVTTTVTDSTIETFLEPAQLDLFSEKARLTIVDLNNQAIHDALTALGWSSPQETEELQDRLATAHSEMTRLARLSAYAPMQLVDTDPNYTNNASIDRVFLAVPLLCHEANDVCTLSYRGAITVQAETKAEAIVQLEQQL